MISPQLIGISLQLIRDVTTAYQEYNYSLSGISLSLSGISLGNSLREFDKRSKYFVFGEIFINSHGLFS